MLPEKNKILLGAYYYLWYGSPTVPIVGGGDWEKSGSTNKPILGKYNSRDQSVIRQHINWAKEAQIDFFAISWNNIGSWDDLTLKDYFLKNPKSSEIKFCIFYDSIPALNRHRFNTYLSYDFNEQFSPQQTKGEKFLNDFEYLADNYFHHPEYLKINGQPVVIIYNTSAFKNVQNYFNKLKSNMEKRGFSLFLIADAVYWRGVKLSKRNLVAAWVTSPSETFKIIVQGIHRLLFRNLEKINLSQYFQGITGYNMYSVNRTENFLKKVDKLYQKFSSYVHLNNLYFIPNVMPGFNDQQLMGLDRPILERRGGEFYKNFWQIVKKYLDPKLKIVLITTFNEWHEGTEIEPSKEYGTNYLELTKLFKGRIN